MWVEYERSYELPHDHSCTDDSPHRIFMRGITKRTLCLNRVNRQKCVWVKNECLAKTAKPTKAPTAFSCDLLKKVACVSKKYRETCTYNVQAKKCESLATAAPTVRYVQIFENRDGCVENPAGQNMIEVFTDKKSLEDYFQVCDNTPGCVGVLKTNAGAKLLGTESVCYLSRKDLKIYLLNKDLFEDDGE